MLWIDTRFTSWSITIFTGYIQLSWQKVKLTNLWKPSYRPLSDSSLFLLQQHFTGRRLCVWGFCSASAQRHGGRQRRGLLRVWGRRCSHSHRSHTDLSDVKALYRDITEHIPPRNDEGMTLLFFLCFGFLFVSELGTKRTIRHFLLKRVKRRWFYSGKAWSRNIKPIYRVTLKLIKYIK